MEKVFITSIKIKVLDQIQENILHIFMKTKTRWIPKQPHKIAIYSSSLRTRIFLIFRVNSFLGIITECWHPSHLMRISIPMRTTFQRFTPHGCAFFISTTSFNPNTLSFNLYTPILLLSIFEVFYCFPFSICCCGTK